MAYGKTLDLRAIKRPAPEFIHEHAYAGSFSAPSNQPYLNPNKDRTLRGKARRQARKAARRRERAA